MLCIICFTAIIFNIILILFSVYIYCQTKIAATHCAAASCGLRPLLCALFCNKLTLDDALNNKKPIDIEHRILLKDTTVRFVQKKCVPILNDAGKVIRMVGTVQDITERKRAEEEIHLLQTTTLAVSASDNLHDALVAVMKQVCNVTGWVYGEVWVLNPDGTLLERNHAFYSTIGGLEKFSEYTEGMTFPSGIGLPGRAWSEKQPVWIPDVTLDPNYLRASIAYEVGLKAGMAFPIIADNEVIAIVVFYKLEVAERDERLIKLVSGVMTQLGLVIKRKQAEKALWESKAQYERLFERNPHPMFVVDQETLGCLAVNSAAVNHYGYSRQEFLGLTIKDICLSEDIQKLVDSLALEKIVAVPIFAGVRRPRKKDGTIIDIEITGNPLSYYGRKALLILAHDITERKKMEEEQAKLREQLYRVQKLESVGTLASGIAHDFNNILTAIIGYANLVQMEMKEDVRLWDFVQKILNSAEKAANLTQGLLAFSRKQISNPSPVYLNEIIKGVESLLVRVMREDIKIKPALTDKECVLMAYVGQMEQVLMNLATNARDAMPKGGGFWV